MKRDKLSKFIKKNQKNIALLAGAAIGGYWLYKKFGGTPRNLDETATVQKFTGHVGPPIPDRHVKNGESISVSKYAYVNVKTAGMKYARAKTGQVDSMGRPALTFKANTDGIYTGKVFVKGKSQWAEILPQTVSA